MSCFKLFTWADIWTRKNKSRNDIAQKIRGYLGGEAAASVRKELLGRIRRQAAGGDAVAQFALGVALGTGDGPIPNDTGRASRWMFMAARQGVPEAQFRLAAMYFSGEGTGPDPARALKWFRQAALLGHAAAQFQVGAMYMAGLGAPRDKARASRFFRKAAENGHAAAQHSLACLCLLGDGVPMDTAEAA
jgi:TPR repeat protein